MFKSFLERFREDIEKLKQEKKELEERKKKFNVLKEKIEDHKNLTKTNDTKQNTKPITDNKQTKKEIIEKNRKERYKKFKKEAIKKGKEYEKFVGKHFEKLGYIIKYNGIENGKKDNSIDLIAIKKDEIILIQCKNWKEDSKYKINHEKVKAFIGDTYRYIENNPIYKDYKIKRLFVISNKILDKSAYYYIKENKDLIEYLLLKFDK